VRPPFGRVVDFCAGCGVVGLGILSREPSARATLVELQARLATSARRNADDNGMGDRVEVHTLDLRRTLQLSFPDFSLAVANPPYRSLDEGPASPDAEVATAQHELEVKLADVCNAMRRVLVPAGRAALVYPASRVGHLLATLEAAGLRPVRARFVHPRAGEPANRVLVEANKGARGPLVVEPPLVLRDADGYTAEAARLLGD
jgi:tRNA1Val (adenine37-N6)-methyltransferase